jgi:hypothetical protein
MVRPQRLLSYRQRTLVERLSLSVLTLGFVEQGQVVQARGHIEMVGAGLFLGHSEGLLGDNDGTAILARTIELHDLLIKGVPFTACALGEHGLCGQHQEQQSRCDCQYVFH